MKAGFSLVELSIVLVILGLLTGGILGGQSLIKAAELRSVATERQQWQIAINSFKGKYRALPGDMPNATAFWGVAANGGGGAGCAQFISTGTETCDGNGNGVIENTEAGILSQGSLRAWQHLANAGLITGQYSGTRHAGTNWDSWHVLGWNVPASKVGGGTGWGMCTSDYAAYGKGERNVFVLGKPGWTGATCGMGVASVLSGQEAWQVDMKLDDGDPAKGDMTAINGYGLDSCVTTSWDENVTESDYQLDDTGASCLLFFKL